jgi:hypothetical protein
LKLACGPLTRPLCALRGCVEWRRIGKEKVRETGEANTKGRRVGGLQRDRREGEELR